MSEGSQEQTLLGCEAVKQTDRYSCWACCTRVVYNFYSGKSDFPSDKNLADRVSLGLGKYQDVQKALEELDLYAGQDDTSNVPSFDEIKEEIDAGRPLIMCITSAKVSFSDNPEGGHYVIVCGYDSQGRICVMDPDTGTIQWIAYHSENSVSGMFWASTYYTQTPGGL